MKTFTWTPTAIEALVELKSWKLTFHVKASDFEAISAFLLDRSGFTTFLWTDPSGEQIKVTCKSFTIKANDLDSMTITADFERVPYGTISDTTYKCVPIGSPVISGTCTPEMHVAVLPKTDAIQAGVICLCGKVKIGGGGGIA